jgi:hypothetical protein
VQEDYAVAGVPTPVSEFLPVTLAGEARATARTDS